MTDKDIIHKELDLVQEVIKRMASNSFEVKKWLIGILSAILIFKHDELLGGNKNWLILLLLPVLCFWYLDAFFLNAEKKYRNMYQWVVKYRQQTDQYLYDLNTMTRTNPDGTSTNLKENVSSVFGTMFSSTIWPFYLVPLILIIVYAVIYFVQEEPAVNCCCSVC